MTQPRMKELDSECSSKFLILHTGWEMDNLGWVMPDGRVYTTNHGWPCRMPVEAIEKKIDEAELSIAGLKRAFFEECRYRKEKGKLND